MSKQIKSMSGQVLYASESASDMRAAVVDAKLQGADLRGAYLYGAYLQGADLRRANLRDAHLQGAHLSGAHLIGADLRGAYLSGTHLRGANLRDAKLQGADLRGAHLYGAKLSGADGFVFDAGPSGQGWILPLDANGKHDRAGEWRPSIGCWRDRSLDDLRDLIEDRAEWPEATGEERDRRRPYLRAVLALCEAHVAYQQGVSS